MFPIVYYTLSIGGGVGKHERDDYDETVPGGNAEAAEAKPAQIHLLARRRRRRRRRRRAARRAGGGPGSWASGASFPHARFGDGGGGERREKNGGVVDDAVEKDEL